MTRTSMSSGNRNNRCKAHGGKSTNPM
jgi:hypothetical protein